MIRQAPAEERSAIRYPCPLDGCPHRGHYRRVETDAYNELVDHVKAKHPGMTVRTAPRGIVQVATIRG